MAEFDARIRVLQDTAANFTSNNPILLLGEWGFETDTKKIKIGDGTSGWGDLVCKLEAVFSDAEKTKLAGIEAGATADQSGAEIKAAYEAESDTNAFTDAEKSKLAGLGQNVLRWT